YKRRIQAGDRFTIEFLSWTSELVQGLTLRTKRGLLEVNDVESSVISLWMDTAPAVVDVECLTSGRDGLLMVSNRWVRPDGVKDEWTNNAGMLVEDSGNRVLLHCSNGYGEPDFDNLVVELRFA